MVNSKNNQYKTHNIVSNIVTFNADHLDTDLVNAWGLVSIKNTLWVSANGTGKLLNYDLKGNKLNPLTGVDIPSSSIILTGGTPTGLVVNTTNGFPTTKIGQQLPSFLIVCTEDGLICTYNPNINPTQAFVVIDNSANNAVYKGLEIIDNYLYVTDFYNNKIDVFAFDWTQLNFSNLNNSPFIDKDSSNPISSDFAPFNVSNILNYLFVSYAKQNNEKHDDVAGTGNGYISIFKPDGTFVKRFASRGSLNSPWAMKIASDDFGIFKGQLLVGNFGNGIINAYNNKGKHIGSLKDKLGNQIILNELWGLIPIYNSVFVSSGPNDESNGLLTIIKPNKQK